jgi:hypothetical protein
MLHWLYKHHTNCTTLAFSKNSFAYKCIFAASCLKFSQQMNWSPPVSIRRTRWERAVVAARPPRGPTARSAHRSDQARTSPHHYDRRSSKSEDQGRGRTGSRRTGLVSSGAGRKGGFLSSFACPPAPGAPPEAEAVDDLAYGEVAAPATSGARCEHGVATSV